MRRHKFRSDFELSLAYKLSEANLQYEYETEKISYQPKIKNYTPDFWFPDYNFFVEAKGKFDAADRAKHLLIKKQNPDIDIRFVFQRARNKIRKTVKQLTPCGVRDIIFYGRKALAHRSGLNDRR